MYEAMGWVVSVLVMTRMLWLTVRPRHYGARRLSAIADLEVGAVTTGAEKGRAI